MINKKFIIIASMLVLALSICLNQFYHLPDFVLGFLMGISIGMGIVVLFLPKIKIWYVNREQN